MKMRIIVSLLCIFVMVGALQACTDTRETITIRYASWNLGDQGSNNPERLMIKAFIEKYPKIHVEIDENFVKNYDEAMNSAISSNNIPDVFMFAGNPHASANGWCADLTDIVGKDREWGNIPLPLRDSAQIKGKTIAVPSTIYLYGYFCNESLFGVKQAALPKVGFSMEQFKASISQMTDINNCSLGLADESSIIEWYPAAVNKEFSWFSWDGGRFNLNSAAFRDGVKLAREICGSHQSFALLSDDEKKKLNGANDWEAWNAGTVAMKSDGTWAVNDHSKLPFKVSFAGLPGGRTCIVPDFLFISKNSSHTEEAYKFVKFMSAYSQEGFTKRMELAEANKLVVSTIPMIKDSKLIDAYFELIKIGGIREAYDKMDESSYIEGTKVLPGYTQARWDYISNITVGDHKNAKMSEVIADAVRGATNIDNVADQLNSAANECVQIFPKPLEN